MLILVILLFVALLISALVLGGVLLSWLFKYFKVSSATFKTALKISIIIAVASGLMGQWIKTLNLNLGLTALLNILSVVLVFFIFNALAKKYYQNTWGQSLKVYIAYLVIGAIASIVVVAPIRSYIVEPFVVSGNAMNPTYPHGSYLLIDKYNKEFLCDEVIILRYPKDPRYYFVKRIIGLPGENVKIISGKIYINETEFVENHGFETMTSEDVEMTLKDDEYFVLGDNRNAASDSRAWGPVSRNFVEGKLLYKVY